VKFQYADLSLCRFDGKEMMLSPKAKAFSIDNLLGLTDSSEIESWNGNAMVRNVCPQSAGSGGMQCIHPSRLSVHGTILNDSIKCPNH